MEERTIARKDMTIEESHKRFPVEGQVYAFCERDPKPLSTRWLCAVAKRSGRIITLLDASTARDETAAYMECRRMMEAKEWENRPDFKNGAGKEKADE